MDIVATTYRIIVYIGPTETAGEGDGRHVKRYTTMRSLIILLFSAVLLCSMASGDCITKDGYFRGKRLCGKVRVVEVGEDFKVRIVTVGEDLKVRIEDYASSSSAVGRWRFVEVGEDFKIRFVTVGEDFKIRFDEISSGVSRFCD